MASRTPNDLDLVTRFVCVGSEEGIHNVLSKQDFQQKTPSLRTFLSKDAALEVINRLESIFKRQSFVSKEPLLYALATIVRNMPDKDKHDDDHVRHKVYDLVARVCESPMDLFTFVSFDKTVSSPEKKAGWGRGMKRIVRHWYESKTPLNLAFQVTRCKSGRGWSHRDLIRQSHICPHKRSKGSELVLNYLAKGKKILEEFKDTEADELSEIVTFLTDVEQLIATKSEDKETIRGLIEKNKFVERQIPSHLFQAKETLESLLGHMDLADMFRNIPKMAELGMLDHAAPEASKVIECVKKFDDIKEQKVPPIVIFVALRRYETNKAKKWVKNQNMVKALHGAFNASLQTLPKTGKRTLLAIHIDSKLGKKRVLGANFLTPLMPCALMAKFLNQSEGTFQLVYFHQEVQELRLTSKMPVVAIIEHILRPTKEPANQMNYDMTKPLEWATQNKRPYDNIVIMCDKKMLGSADTFHSALKSYRQELSLPANKLVVVGLSDQTVVGNRNDLNFLEICGFNERIPDLIYSFCTGSMDYWPEDVPAAASEDST